MFFVANPHIRIKIVHVFVFFYNCALYKKIYKSGQLSKIHLKLISLGEFNIRQTESLLKTKKSPSELQIKKVFEPLI